MRQIKRFLWPMLGLTCVVVFIAFTLNNNTQTAAEEIKAEQKPVSFIVTATHAKKATTELDAPIRGHIEAKNVYTLYSEADGKVIQSSIIVGDTVTKGQSLISIDASSRTANQRIIEQSLKKAQFDLDFAQKQLVRYQALLENENTSTVEYENAKSQVESAEVQLRTVEQELALAKIQIGQTKVTAPASGVIIEKNVNKGDYVQPGTPLGTLAENTLIVKCFVPGTIALQSQIEQEVEIIADALPDKKLIGSIKTIVPHPNEAKLYPIEIELDENNKLMAGMGVTIFFSGKENAMALLIPRTALVGDFKNPTVYTINAQKQPVEQKIEVGKTVGNQVEVLEGLNENDLIVLSGQGNIELGKVLADYKLVK